MPLSGYAHSQRYDRAHRMLRARLVAAYTPGDPCGICGEEMRDSPALLDLAHNEAGTDYKGLAHRVCNRGDASRLAASRRVGPDPDPEPRTRW